ncbi:putative GAMM1 protein [Monocercomonoides exilis]|uniref:putative GAMM1 protein n=1 Tax=Monocercomonoides exilis TaxID=2049356 RepID=UPI00355A0997|nr:putative GAMM1 protein [Monocercomonoides exilis]
MEIFGGKSAGIKMAASGLIYRHFGKRLLTTIYPNLAEDEFSLNIAYNKLYSRLIKEVDAEDNGIDPWSGVEGFKPLYSTHTNLGARVGMLNVWWCEDYSQEKENTRFMEAVEICRTELLSQMKWVVENFLPARKIVQEAYAKREGPIMIIEGKCGPWKEHLFEIEAEAKAEEPVLNVVSFDRGRQQWNCICVPDSPQSFGLRLGFPPEWRGLRNEELEKVSGIKGTVFTHASGFMGSNETKEGAIEMARRSAELQKDKMPEVMQLFKSTRDLYAST